MFFRISSLIQSALSSKAPPGLDEQLCEQARRGCASAIDELLRLGANPHYASPKHAGATALMLAAQGGRHESVAKLVGVSQPNATDDNGFTALIHAAISGNQHSVPLLFPHDDPDMVDHKHEFSALMWACFSSRSVVAHLLIGRCDARIHAPRCDQLNMPSTALMLAASNGRSDLVYGLLTHSDPRHQTANGSTASSFARQAGKNRLADRIDALTIALSEQAELARMNSDVLNHEEWCDNPHGITDCAGAHPASAPLPTRGSLRI